MADEESVIQAEGLTHHPVLREALATVSLCRFAQLASARRESSLRGRHGGF